MKTKALLVFLLLYPFLAESASTIVELRLSGAIHAITAEYVSRGIDYAVKQKADAVVIHLQTPGGVVASTREIISKMINAPIPVIVYIAPSGSRATSAGFYITIAADVAAMAPGTHLGSASPVTLGQEGPDTENSKTMRKKATEDMTAYVKTLAEKRGRNVQEAEKAVRESVSFTETEALAKNLINFVAKDLKELLQKLNGIEIRRMDGSVSKLSLKEPRVQSYAMTRRQRFLSFLADPNITVLLFGIGMAGILIELYNPGAILPGIVGVISISLCFLAGQILPINFTGALLIGFAIVLFILELKIASYGLLTLGGVVSFVLGATMLFDAPIPEMRISLKVIGLSVGLITATMVFLMVMVVRLHRKKPLTGMQGLLQEIGTAQTDIETTGQVFVHGEIWQAKSSQKINKGDRVRIVSANGLTLDVEKCE